MRILSFLLAALLATLCFSGCTKNPSAQLNTGATPIAASEPRKRATPVVPERPARMFIWAGFNEKDCTAATPTITVTQKPTKGTVTLRPNQQTKIRQSNSGKCLGHALPGTGIYYTANKDQTGTDLFAVTATTKSGQSATRSFQVNITQ